MAEPRSIDWEGVEREYRVGILSLREIGTQFGCTHAAIRKRAAKEGWVRDLGAKIRARAEALVSSKAVSSEVSTDTKAAEREIVEVNANAQVEIRLAHRTDIKTARELFGTLLAEVAGVTERPDLAEQLFELMADPHAEDAEPAERTKKDQERYDKLRQAFDRVMSIGGRVDAAKKLTEMLEKLVRMEREAFGIQTGDKPPEDPASALTPDRMQDAVRRMAYLLAFAARNQEPAHG